MTQFLIRSLGCLLLIALSASAVAAQTSTSSITGTVTDSTGAVVPGATVTATNEATGGSQTQTTTDAGLYAFPSLPVGTYTVSVERQGFKTTQKTNNLLQINTPLAVDISLEAGQVSETVTVQGGIEQLQTANATIGNVVEQKAIEQLPLNGRNPLTLLTLEPGVVQRSQGGAGSGVHVNGSRDRAFNVTIDGIDANESSVPNPVSNLYRLTPDNVREYKVTTNNATAEEGRNSGASISVATRSGTNELHGNAFYFLRNDALNANEFFNNAQGVPKPTIKLNQFGGEAGGPIRKNKTFFFASYQRNDIRFQTPVDQAFGAVPLVYTPTLLTGNFRYFRANPNNTFRINNQPITQNSPLLVDPRTGQLRPEVRLCTSNTDTDNCVATYNIFTNANVSGINPAITSFMQGIPAPNSYAFGDGLNFSGFVWNPPTQHKGPAYMARIDHTFSESNSVFGRYLQSQYDTVGGDPLNGRPVVFPGFPPLGEVFRGSKNLAISWRSVLNPRIVNEVTMGFSRFNFLFTQGEANPAFPNIPPFDLAAVDEPVNLTPRTQRAVTTPQILDNLSIVEGAHLIRLGTNFRFYRHVDRRGQPGGANLTPAISFSGSLRSPANAISGLVLPGSAQRINSTDNTNLLSIFNTLVGIPARLQQTFIGDLTQDQFLPFLTGDSVTLFAESHHVNQYNAYIQDEWKARPNLSLSYGVRWEFNPPASTPGRVFVPATPIVGTPGPDNPVVNTPGPVSFIRAKQWWRRNNVNALGPRLGLAWSPDYKSGFLHKLFGNGSQSVVRLGYGVAYDAISSFQVTAVAGRVPGLLTTCSSTVGGSTTQGCTPADTTGALRANNFPQQFPGTPNVRPSTFLTPPLQTNGNAPPLITFDPKLQLPTVHQWNLSFQRELPGGFVAQMAYVGRRGTHLLRAYNINQINPDPILGSFLLMQQNVRNGCLPAGNGPLSSSAPCTNPVTAAQIPLLAANVAGINTTFVNSSTTQGELDPTNNNAGSFAERIENTTLAFKLRPNQQFGIITYIDAGGDSYYHAGQFTLRRRFSSGIGLNLAYTYAKSIDDQSVDPVGSASGGGLSTTVSRAPTDIRDWRLDRARSDFDRRHVLSVASVWDLPVGRGKRFLTDANGVVNQLLGGWSINAIYDWMTGEPFSVRSGSRTANAGHESNAVIVSPVQPRLTNLPGVVGPVVFENADAFRVPLPGQNGAGRNIFTGPGYWNLDLGFVKRVDLSERFKLQFRTEMFNALNHVNFNNPRDASVGSPSIKSRVFGQTCCAAVAPPSSQTVIQTGEAARVIQFALKLEF